MDKEKDIFNEIIKDKLLNYSLPVDHDSWDKIEERLNAASPENRKRIWITTLSAAASIALLIILFQFNKKVYNNETANQLPCHEETIIQTVPEKEIVQSDLQPTIEAPTVSGKSQPDKRLAENEFTAEVVIKSETKEEILPSITNEGTDAKENQLADAKEETGSRENTSNPQVYDFYRETEVALPIIKNKKRQSLNLSFGSGSNLLASNDADLPRNPQRTELSSEYIYFRAATQDITEPQAEDILLNEDYPNAVHYMPISLGITVKKDLNSSIAIESGIVYSFIASSFSKESSYKSKADLQLHYIGIPLNLHTRLYRNRNSQWSLYLAAGGMVEKGVLSHFVQKTFYNDNNNTIKTVKSNEKIKGLQWSVGLSPGIDYKLYKNYSIYLEPKISYYFDNNQPESSRTKHPVTVGINAGVRYTW